MADSGNGGSGGDGEGRGFAAGLAIGATITFVVTATLAPLVGFFSYPICHVLDRSDDIMIGNYDKALAKFKENRRQEGDATMHIEVRSGIIASRATKMEELVELRKFCLSGQDAHQLGEQETTKCNEGMDVEYQKKMSDLEKSYAFHRGGLFDEKEQLFKIQEEGDFLARHMRLQIEERAKLPEVCHQFFSMKTLDDLMKEPIRPAPVRFW